MQQNKLTIIKEQNTIDLLNRKKLAINFLEVIKTQNANVYSINAPWGEGKTHFLKFIEEEAIKQEIPFIQFNVWETDYAKDPFVVILNELSSLLNIQIEKCPTKNDIAKFKKEIEIIRFYAEKFFNIRNRLCVSFGLNKVFSPIATDIEINADTSSLTEFEEMKKAKNDFIQSLNKFIDIFNTKLIIAIDELDRCRPDYTITTLEVIKHFFNIPNIVFILAVDKQQLQMTVKTLFGCKDENIDSYLKKFVDIQYILPSNNKEKFIENLCKIKYPIIHQTINELNKDYKILRYDNSYNIWSLTSYPEDLYLSDINNLISSLNFSLRDIEKLCLKMSIVFSLILKQRTILQLDFLVYLIYLNNTYPELYKNIKNNCVSKKDADLLMELNNNPIFNYICSAILNYENRKENHDYNDDARDLYISYQDIISYFDKIDFAENFS